MVPASSAGGEASSGEGPRPDDPTNGESAVDAGPGVEGDRFANGSRFLIEQRELSVVSLGHPEVDFRGGDLEQVPPLTIVEGPSYNPRFEVNVPLNTLPTDLCAPGFVAGQFEIEAIDVTPDLDGRGSHIEVDRRGKSFVLSHDGPGRHSLTVRGAFVVENPEALEPENPGTLFPEECEALPWGSRLPVTFRRDVDVVAVASVGISTASHCSEVPFVLSGRALVDPRIALRDAAGNTLLPANADPNYPIDVVLETEGEAVLEAAEFGSPGDGIVLVGASQGVRLSSSFGPSLHYHLVEPGQIDGWNVAFWYVSSTGAKPERQPIVLGATYPARSSGGHFGASATMTITGVPVCSPFVVDDFELRSISGSCQPNSVASHPEGAEVPGLFALAGPLGTCAVDFAFPAGNGGDGLHIDFSTTFASGVTDTGPVRAGTEEDCTFSEPIELRDPFDVVWLAQYGCEVLDGSLDVRGSALTDLSLLATLREVTGDVVFGEINELRDLSALSGLIRIGGALELRDLTYSAIDVVEFPALVEVGSLHFGRVAQTRAFLAPSLISAGEVELWSNAMLEVIDLGALRAAVTVSITTHEALHSLALDALNDVSELTISSNPLLPQCQVDALAELAEECLSCAGNDENATCD